MFTYGGPGFVYFLVIMAGHAFEARIYAENVLKGFLPATGVLHHYRPVSVSSTGQLHHMSTLLM
jgi:acetyl/propionyl-CoA carboxylase alpha subunit